MYYIINTQEMTVCFAHSDQATTAEVLSTYANRLNKLVVVPLVPLTGATDPVKYPNIALAAVAMKDWRDKVQPFLEHLQGAHKANVTTAEAFHNPVMDEEALRLAYLASQGVDVLALEQEQVDFLAAAKPKITSHSVEKGHISLEDGEFHEGAAPEQDRIDPRTLAGLAPDNE